MKADRGLKQTENLTPAKIPHVYLTLVVRALVSRFARDPAAFGLFFPLLSPTVIHYYLLPQLVMGSSHLFA